MNRLFLKLLGWLLLANLITVLVVFVLARPLLDPSLSARNVQAWGDQAVSSYEEGGEAALRQMLRKLHQDQRVLAMLYDTSGNALLRSAPRQLRHWPSRRLRHGRGRAAGDHALDQWIEGAQGQYRWVVLPRPPSGRHAAQLRVVASLLGIVLAAWLVAWWLIRPIRQLRLTTAAMAQDTLSARVSEKLVRRRDEVGS